MTFLKQGVDQQATFFLNQSAFRSVDLNFHCFYLAVES